MTTKHTPGPWTYDKKDGSIGTQDGLTVTAGSYGYDIACSDADGILMAAAPELLDALRVMIAWANAEPGTYPGGYPGTQAAKAIAKATGEK